MFGIEITPRLVFGTIGWLVVIAGLLAGGAIGFNVWKEDRFLKALFTIMVTALGIIALLMVYKW